MLRYVSKSNAAQGLKDTHSSSGKVDDIDLNEIFAEYFINEFDDPINAYTNSMANYSTGSVTMPMANEGNKPQEGRFSQGAASTMSLPTGGIRTTFHAGVAPPRAQDMPPPVPLSHPSLPPPKRAKVESESVAHHSPLLIQPSIPAAHAHQQALAAAAQQAVAASKTPSGGISLPVGVGIRLGGVGGIAPATAQSAARVPPLQDQYSMWTAGNGGMTEQAIAERRQRNREHAKRSRVRKKFMLESLQEQVRSLQRENQRLRLLVQEEIPEKAVQIISECCTSSALLADLNEQTGMGDPDEGEGGKLDRSDFNLMQCLSAGQQCFVLSDPKLPDNPIVFASPGFYKLTGYTSEQVLGRNCRFLQGPGTDPAHVDVIRKAVATGADATICLLNYKADGSPFWNQFFIAALRDSDNCIVNYVRCAHVLSEGWSSLSNPCVLGGSTD